MTARYLGQAATRYRNISLCPFGVLRGLAYTIFRRFRPGARPLKDFSLEASSFIISRFITRI